MNKLQQLYQKQQAKVQEYLDTRKIMQEIYDIVCYHWDENDDKRVKNLVKLSTYPKTKLSEKDPHEDKIITEINLYPQTEDEMGQLELLRNLALIKNPQQKDMLEALINSSYGFYKIIDRDDIKA
ncbi:MAG: hypothetical protein LUG46_02600, partial [Erysipelotrichaceae bacterium]|nr:hypothetical protein [Erysipelotrichaceae bacterium]